MNPTASTYPLLIFNLSEAGYDTIHFRNFIFVKDKVNETLDVLVILLMLRLLSYHA